jgi:hypothetical protein
MSCMTATLPPDRRTELADCGLVAFPGEQHRTELEDLEAVELGLVKVVRRGDLQLVRGRPALAEHQLACAMQGSVSGRLRVVAVVEGDHGREPAQGDVVGLASPLGARGFLALADLRERFDRRSTACFLDQPPQRIDRPRARQREAAAVLVVALGRSPSS